MMLRSRIISCAATMKLRKLMGEQLSIDVGLPHRVTLGFGKGRRLCV